MIRLLLVEDNELNLDMLTRRLSRLGFETHVARDGAQAIEMTKELKPDVVLMDMSLPVMDGWEATKRLKSDELTKEIPIIGLSAHALSEDRDRALEVGCDEYETKPVHLNRLLECIQRLTGYEGTNES